MSNKSGPSLSALVFAFTWRWLIASLIAWLVGFIVLIVLALIVSVIVAVATGATTPEALEKPVGNIITVLGFPILFIGIPGISAVIAFVWALYSPEFKSMVQTPGFNPQPVAVPGTASNSSTGDPYTQYTQAYQRWQKEYAAFQETKKTQAVPPLAPPPSADVTSPVNVTPLASESGPTNTTTAAPQNTNDTPVS